MPVVRFTRHDAHHLRDHAKRVDEYLRSKEFLEDYDLPEEGWTEGNDSAFCEAENEARHDTVMFSFGYADVYTGTEDDETEVYAYRRKVFDLAEAESYLWRVGEHLRRKEEERIALEHEARGEVKGPDGGWFRPLGFASWISRRVNRGNVTTYAHDLQCFVAQVILTYTTDRRSEAEWRGKQWAKAFRLHAGNPDYGAPYDAQCRDLEGALEVLSYSLEYTGFYRKWAEEMGM